MRAPKRGLPGALSRHATPTNEENEYMVAWDRVTRADVLHAIKEYDRLGPEQFTTFMFLDAAASMPMQAARRMKRGSAVRAFIHNWSPRECAARAAAATDALTRARFQQEQQQWLTLARAAEQEEHEQFLAATDFIDASEW
jgi:hypothetical protein